MIGQGRDWEAYYRDGDWEREAGIAGEEAMTTMADRFIDLSAPADFASVGCGPAAVIFRLAELHPGIEFYGIDLSETIIADNRRVATDRELDNVHFVVDSLPELSLDRSFDVVYCVGASYWVERIEAAVVDLYDHVAAGGSLVVNYPNLYLHYEVVDELSAETRDSAPLVRDRQNLLTFDRIGELLGRKPRSYYNLVDGSEHREVKWPIVVVEKPGS